MSSMLNISARRENLNVSPSVVNNVNVNANFSKLNKIPIKPPTARATQRNTQQRTRDIETIDESIKVINSDGSASVYVEHTPTPQGSYYEQIDNNNEQIDVAYSEQQTEQIQQPQDTQQTIKQSINNEVNVLTQYINLLKEHNIVKAEKFILNADELANIVLLITQANEVNISLNNDIGCVSIGKKRQVDNIYIIKDNTRNDFKLFYPSEYAYLRDLRIDLKNVIIG